MSEAYAKGNPGAPFNRRRFRIDFLRNRNGLFLGTEAYHFVSNRMSRSTTLFAVIAENDESPWSDDTGVLYHFPRRYTRLLKPGIRVVYYTGKMRKAEFAIRRLSTEPHYFGTATIGSVHSDRNSAKGDLFATIEGFRRFSSAVPARDERGAYYEQIPPNRSSNFWRDGVRAADRVVVVSILRQAGMSLDEVSESAAIEVPTTIENDLESALEGSPTMRYVTTYERHPRYRKQALAIHGYTCHGCDVDMMRVYGPYAQGLIQIHHTQPVSTFAAPRRINPAVDLVPVCPNCHAVIHRKRTSTLSIPELRALIASVRANELASTNDKSGESRPMAETGWS